jgi:hypothetical protein
MGRKERDHDGHYENPDTHVTSPSIFGALFAAVTYDVEGNLVTFAQLVQAHLLDGRWTNNSLPPPPSSWIKP